MGSIMNMVDDECTICKQLADEAHKILNNWYHSRKGPCDINCKHTCKCRRCQQYCALCDFVKMCEIEAGL